MSLTPPPGSPLSPEEYTRNVEAYEARTLQIIAEHGWMLQGVFPTRAEPGPEFQYTVGLTQFGHPELIIFGLPQQIAGQLLNDLGRRVRDGAHLEHGQVLEDLLVRLPARLVAVDDTTEHFGMARRLYPVVRGLQVVWPDGNGMFPWDIGYAITSGLQPVLGTP